MADKIIAPIAYVVFIVFVSFLALYVNEPDLWIVLVAVVILGAYDFWRDLRQSE